MFSVVKHSDNEDDNSRLLNLGVGHRGVSFLPLWSFRIIQRKMAVYLGQHKTHTFLKINIQFEQMKSGSFLFIYWYY